MEEIKMLNENELEAVTGGERNPGNPEDRAVIIAQFAAAKAEYRKLAHENGRDAEILFAMAFICDKVCNGDVYDYARQMAELKKHINDSRLTKSGPALRIYNTYLEPLNS